MNKSEARIQSEIMRDVGSRPDVRLFRNTCGFGYQGTVVTESDNSGHTVLRNARPCTFGLMPGSADLIGWVVKDGRAIFLSLEVKGAKGRPSKEQTTWLNNVRRMGGIAGIVRSVEEANQIIDEHEKK